MPVGLMWLLIAADFKTSSMYMFTTTSPELAMPSVWTVALHQLGLMIIDLTVHCTTACCCYVVSCIWERPLSEVTLHLESGLLFLHFPLRSYLTSPTLSSLPPFLHTTLPPPSLSLSFPPPSILLSLPLSPIPQLLWTTPSRCG